MAIVLIVSKTQMRNGICIGGIDESNCELIRLHDSHGANLKPDVPYEIGDRWEMSVEPAWNNRPLPHTEDKQTMPNRKVDNVGVQGIISYIQNHSVEFGDKLVRGSLDRTFVGCLKFFETRNFINRERVPNFSTQFWIADKDLVLCNRFNKSYYVYGKVRIKFVGYQKLIERIPAGTIVRLSLANWWNGDGCGEDRCYLQLSGWYL